MTFIIENRGLIFDAAQQDAQHRIAFFTSLCLLKSGTLLCGFQNGSAKHAVNSTIRLCRSADSGLSWQLLPTTFQTTIDGVPGSFGAGEIVETEPGRLLMFATWFDRSDPARPLFDPVTEGILKSKQLLAVSSDEGTTWSDWRELPTDELKGCALTGPVLRWENGTLGFAFESFKEFDDPRPGRHAAWLILSRDGGRTFSPPQQVAQHPEHALYYWDQRLCTGKLADEFTAMFWTHDLVAQRDRNVHLRAGKLVDNALVLDAIHETSIPGQIAAPLWCQDGTLCAFVVDRNPPGTMTLWRSSDAGQTWPAEDRLVVHTHDERAALSQGQDQIDFKQYWEDMIKWSFGHPALRTLPDGRLLLAWYAGSPDCMSIHWAHVRDTTESSL